MNQKQLNGKDNAWLTLLIFLSFFSGGIFAANTFLINHKLYIPIYIEVALVLAIAAALMIHFVWTMIFYRKNNG